MPVINYSLGLDEGKWKRDTGGGLSCSKVTILDPYILPAGSAATLIATGSVSSANLVYVESDQDITVYINSAAGTAHTVTKDKPFFLAGTVVTALYAANGGTLDANLSIVAAELDASTAPPAKYGLGYFNVKDYGAKGDGSTDDTAAIQAAIDACEAAGGGIVWFPSGSYKITATLTVQSSGVCPLGASRNSTIIAITGSVDGFAFGVTGTNQEYHIISGLKITGGRYGINLNNIQQSKFSDLLIVGGTEGIHCQGQIETSEFSNLQFAGQTSYGIRTGDVNGGPVSGNYNFPVFQKCALKNLTFAGASGSTGILMTAGNAGGTQHTSGYSTFEHIVVQGLETTPIVISYTQNLRFARFSNEQTTLPAANTYSVIKLGAGCGFISLYDCFISTRANDLTTFKYGIEQLDGYVWIEHCTTGGGAAGTADIYIAGISATIKECGLVGGSSTGILFDNGNCLSKSLIINTTDATNAPITSFVAHTPFIAPSGVINRGLIIGDSMVGQTGGSIGFYGTVPIAQPALSATPSATEISTVLHALGLVS